MKVLVVTPVPTHPTTSGNAGRIWMMARELAAQGHEVDCFHISFQEGAQEEMLRAWGDRFHPYIYRKPWRKYRWIGIPIPDRWHHWPLRKGWLHQRVDQFFDEGALSVLSALQERECYDAVVVEYVFFSKALDAFPRGVLKIIDTHDVYADRHKRLINAGLAPEWFFTSRAEERKGLMRADRIMAIQDREAAFFNELLRGARPVHNVGHLFSLPNEEEVCVFANPLRFGVFGSGNSLNVAGLDWFVREVLPLLPESFTLKVIGSMCGAVGEHPRIEKLGMVPTPGDAYRNAEIFLNLMQWGTGLKIKSIEALAYGRILLSSPCGLEGLEAACSEDCRRLSSPAEWAATIRAMIGLENAQISNLNRAFSARYLEDCRKQLREIFSPS